MSFLGEKTKTFGKSDINNFKRLSTENIENVIDDCLTGTVYSEGRSNQCLKLAEECYNIMREVLNEAHREKYRNNIIADSGIKNIESEDFVKIVAGKEYPSLYGYNKLYDPTSDEEDYIQSKLKSPLGVCDIALFGLEKQFTEQIENGFFQSIHHGNAMKTAEHLVLDEKAAYEDVPNPYSIERHFRKLTSDERRVIAEDIVGSDIDMKLVDDIARKDGFKYIHRNLYPKLMKYYQTEYPDEISTIPRLAAHTSPGGLVYETRNDVVNPKIQANKYRIGSRADLNSKQWFFIEKNTKIDDGFNVSTWEEAKKLTVRVFWEEMKPSAKVRAIKSAIENAKKKGYSDKTIHHLENPTDDFDDFNDDAQESIRIGIISLGDMFDDAVINETLEKRMAKYKYIMPDGAILNCWHSFLGFFNYPKRVRDEWIEINDAWKNGDIDEKTAMNLIRDLEHLERKFTNEAEKQAAIENNANPDRREYIPMTEMGMAIFTEANETGFVKPTQYQPLRLRLYGSQKYINDIINNFTYDQSIITATNNNSQTLNVFRKAFTRTEMSNLRLDRTDEPNE
ncbi:hypothetical protein LCGC14_1262180 [marine sediment metagenome]|uniref:Uncharacterized protein n=1 Tax=marine sediment metagenome TaxID=412755 RepID=A0A0F9L2U0_9ZZZZ